MRKLTGMLSALALLCWLTPAQAATMRDANYIVQPTDTRINTATVLTAQRTITLPYQASLLAPSIEIVDSFKAINGVNNFLIVPQASETVNGLTSLTINIPGSRVYLTPGNTGWYAQVIPPTVGATPYNPSGFSFLGDSRMAYLSVALGNNLTAQQWFNVANARMNKRFIIGTNAGGSGCRSDQFLAPVNINAVLADPGQYVMIHSPAVNDISALTGNGIVSTVGGSCSNAGGSFPYTNNNGVTVTAANVGSVVATNVIAATEQIIATGKTVLLVEEPGSTSFTAAQIAQLYDLNLRLRAYAVARQGQVLLFSYNSVVWNPTSSATAIAFKAGYSTDGTHYSPQGAYAQATAFITYWSAPQPNADLAISNINFINTTTPRSLSLNPLFTTLTGGTNGGHCSSITGNIPASWTVDCGNAGTTVTITSAADAGGYGNDITLAITTTTADPNIFFVLASPSTSLYNLTDYINGGMDISVASGSANASCYIQTGNVTDQGNTQQYDLYPNNAGSFITTAYSYRLQSLLRTVNPGSTSKSFLIPLELICTTTAAGNVTVTVSRAWAARGYVYNPTTGIFLGQ